MTAFIFTAEYKRDLLDFISAMFADAKAGQSPRDERIYHAGQLVEAYVAHTGTTPDGSALDRLADLCLYDELYDRTPYKIANTEYPFMNERMFDERAARDTKVEALEKQQMRQLGGTRRQRTRYENAFMDRETKTRNKERRKRYNEFKRGERPGVLTVDIASGWVTRHVSD